MAITFFAIVQDNQLAGCDVFSVHNPLVFMLDVEHDDTDDPAVSAEIFDTALEAEHGLDAPEALLYQGRAMPYLTVIANPRRVRYRFDAAPPMRISLGSFDDELAQQAVGTVAIVDNMHRAVRLRLHTATDGGHTAASSWVAVNAATQYGGAPAMLDWWDNPDADVYVAEGGHAYMHYYTRRAYDVLEFEGAATTAFADVPANTMLRLLHLATPPLTALQVFGQPTGEAEAVLLHTTNLRPIRKMRGGVAFVIKYLNLRGYFAFAWFNYMAEIKDEHEQLGRLRYVGSGVASDRSPTRSIGTTKVRTYQVTAEAVEEGELHNFAALEASPTILFASWPLATDRDPWVLVDSIEGGGVVRAVRGGPADVTYTLTMPQFYTITRK